jgi:hypothetical protein
VYFCPLKVCVCVLSCILGWVVGLFFKEGMALQGKDTETKVS